MPTPVGYVRGEGKCRLLRGTLGEGRTFQKVLQGWNLVCASGNGER